MISQSAIFKPSEQQSDDETWQRIPVEDVGQSMNDVLERFGSWNPIADIGMAPDDKSFGYPFSSQEGYDYFVCVDSDNRVTKAWKRRKLHLLNPPISPTAEPDPVTKNSGFQRISPDALGATLADAERRLGKHDVIGGLVFSPDFKSMGYPFSNRDGFDFFVVLGDGDQIVQVWRAKPMAERFGTTESLTP